MSHYSLFWPRDLSIFPPFDSFEGIVNARMRNKRENPRNPQTKKKYFLIFYLSAIFSHFFQAQIVDNIPAQIEREKRVFKNFS